MRDEAIDWAHQVADQLSAVPNTYLTPEAEAVFARGMEARQGGAERHRSRQPGPKDAPK